MHAPAKFIGNSVTPPDPIGSGVGVEGISNRGPGVYGLSSSSTNYPGVSGESTMGGDGVVGTADHAGSGVIGTSYSGAGVYGRSTSGDGGHFTTARVGNSGVYGENTSENSSANGVYGKITPAGVGVAIWGENPASVTLSGAFAGVFDGDVNVTNGYSYYYNGKGGSGTGHCIGGPCSSDERLKKDIKPLTGALAKLLALKGVTFNWKDPQRPDRQTGFIAQEVEKVFPSWVETKNDGMKAILLTPLEVLSLQVEAMRTLQEENDQLKAELRANKQATDDRISNLENGSHPIAASFTSGLGISPGNLGISLLGVLGAFIVSRRKKDEKTA